MEDPQAASQPQLVAKSHTATTIMGLYKLYKNCLGRYNHVDCNLIFEKLWWKTSDFVALRESSVTFFKLRGEAESATSRWSRTRIRVAKVGKGLSKDVKTKKLLLAFKYWVEAVDPIHRYGNNLHHYYVAWYNSQTSQPFFYWLDFGNGKEVTLEECPRAHLQYQRVKYLTPKEREAYEVIVDDGKLVYKHNGSFVDTPQGTKWIFVLSTLRILYVGEKQKGLFQHSSFIAGGPVISAGRIIICDGILQAIWAYSGHYRPTEDNLKELMIFLEEHHLDLSLVKTVPTDDDIPPAPAPGRDRPSDAVDVVKKFSNVVI